MTLSTIEAALDALRLGRPVLVLDDEDRENEGDVVLAGQTLTDQWMAWTIRNTSGYICAPVTEDVADRLVRLPVFYQLTDDGLQRVVDAATAFAV